MSEFIHEAKPKNEKPGDPEYVFIQDLEETIGFTKGDNPSKIPPTVDVESKLCFAKISVYEGADNTQRKRFYVKQSLHGMYDPWGIYQEGTQNKFARLKGRDIWEFREVSNKVFRYYLMFLQSRNKAWLRNAERMSRYAT